MTRKTKVIIACVAAVLAIIGVAGAGIAYSAAPSTGSDPIVSSSSPAVASVTNKLLSEYNVSATDTPELSVATRSTGTSSSALPNGSATELSESQAIDKVKGIAQDQVSGSWISARHAIITDRDLAGLSDRALASQGVKNRPKDRSAWVVTFHNIRKTHQIHGYPPDVFVGDEVAIVDAVTGDVISEFVDATPVRK